MLGFGGFIGRCTCVDVSNNSSFRCKMTCSHVLSQDLAAADKERVAKLKADMPPVPKPTKPAKADKPDKVPRAKTAYMV